jgi:hypothetical protein
MALAFIWSVLLSSDLLLPNLSGSIGAFLPYATFFEERDHEAPHPSTSLAHSHQHKTLKIDGFVLNTCPRPPSLSTIMGGTNSTASAESTPGAVPIVGTLTEAHVQSQTQVPMQAQVPTVVVGDGTGEDIDNSVVVMSPRDLTSPTTAVKLQDIGRGKLSASITEPIDSVAEQEAAEALVMMTTSQHLDMAQLEKQSVAAASTSVVVAEHHCGGADCDDCRLNNIAASSVESIALADTVASTTTDRVRKLKKRRGPRRTSQANKNRVREFAKLAAASIARADTAQQHKSSNIVRPVIQQPRHGRSQLY